MTPDAVIYRYLECISPVEVDVGLLCDLLSADADLLARWLRLMDIPADLAQLRTALDELSASELQSMASAQAWSELPLAGNARLSLDQWQAALRAGYLAETLASLVNEQELSSSELENIRLRGLLAISGVQLEQDPRLIELVEFRGTNPALLEDAALELRVFAVIDAIELGNDADLARTLLGIERSTYDAQVAIAQDRARSLVRRLAVDLSDDVDWEHAIWLRQQINIVGSALRGCASVDELAVLHLQVSRCLFTVPPLLMLYESDTQRYALWGNRGVRISADSTVSRIASVARSGATQRMSESADLAVVDRQLLRMLGSEEAVVTRAGESPHHGILIVHAEDDVDVESAATLYAQELGVYLDLYGEPQPIVDEATQKIDQFRAAERQRLREIVHEANNPLSIVRNYLHILELRMQQEPDAVEQIESIASEVQRASEIFARARDVPDDVLLTAPTGEVSEFELNALLTRLAELHRGLGARYGTEVLLDLSARDIVLRIDESRLTQIVTNLVKNAVEACSPGDTVTVGSRQPIYRDGRSGVEILVRDTGSGIPENVLASLGDGQRSEKGGEHQGLGLLVAFRLARELQGALDVRTRINEGTEFSLYLPDA